MAVEKRKNRWGQDTMILVSIETRDKLKMKAAKLKITVKKLLEMFSNEK